MRWREVVPLVFWLSLALALLICGIALFVEAQTNNPAADINLQCVRDASANCVNVGDNVNSAVKVNIVAGGGAGGTSSTFGAAFPASGTAAGARDTGGNMQSFTLDAAGAGANLKVNCAVGCSGGPADESAFTFGTTAIFSGGVFQTTATNNALANLQAGVFQVTAQRALFSNLRNSSGTEVATSANPIRTDPTGTTTQPISCANCSGTVTISGTVTANAGTNLNTSALALDTSVNGVLRAQGSTTSGQTGPLIQGAVTTAAPSYTTGQTSPVSLTTAGATRVDGSAVTQPVSGTVTANAGSGTFNIQANASTNVAQIAGTATVTAGVAGLQAIGGNVASAAADSGNPVKTGGIVATSLPTAGANGNRFDLMVDKFGRNVATLNADRALHTVCSAVTVSTTTETTLCAAGAAGVFLDLEHLSCSNTSATLVRVDIRDATAGTVRKSMALAASGGGFEMNLPTLWPQTTAANAWTIQLSGAVTDVRCQAVAVQNK